MRFGIAQMEFGSALTFHSLYTVMGIFTESYKNGVIMCISNKFGLLPDGFFDTNNHIVSLDASRFMAGMETNVYDGRTIKHKVRYGEPDDYIFNQEIAMFVKKILNYSSSDSHTNEDDPYIIEEDKKEIFFGYLLQLCHVIKWLGEYINSNPNIEANKAKIKVIPLSTSNTAIAETEKKKDTKVVEEKVVEIPSIDSLIGTKCNIVYHKCGKLACGPYCKLDSKHSPMLGKKAIIKNIVQNEGKDSAELPYIATEIEIVL